MMSYRQSAVVSLHHGLAAPAPRRLLLLGEARQVRHEQRRPAGELDHEVAVRHRVHRVCLQPYSRQCDTSEDALTPRPSPLAVGRAKPSAEARLSRSTPNGLPARAPEPSGHSFILSAACTSLPWSRRHA